MTGMTSREITRARRAGEHSTMSADTLHDILDQAQGNTGEDPVKLSPLGATPKRWLRFLRAPHGALPEMKPEASSVLKGMAKGREGAFIWATVASLLGAVSSAMIPWTMGNAIDTGLEQGIGSAFAVASAIFVCMVALVAIGDSMGQMGEMALWNTGEFSGRRVVTHRAADRPRALKRSHTGGDIVTAAVDDSTRIGELYTDIPEIAATTASVSLVSYLMLSTSIPLGLTILIGLPLSLALLSLIARPLEKRQEAMRSEQGHLTTIATDAVQGLRILRGIGGEDAYAQAYEKQSEKLREVAIQAALTASLLNSARVVAPMLMITIVVAQGAYLAFHGFLTPGQLLAFYGFTLYMRHPMWIATRFIEHFTAGRVGARRIASILGVEPVTNDEATSADSSQKLNWADACLDAEGVSIEAGKLTAIVAANPDHSARLATAFARVEDPTSLRVNGVPAQQIPLEEIRANIVLSEATPHLFAGTLREELLASQAPLPHARGVTETIWRHQLDSAATSEEGSVTVTETPADSRLLRALNLAHAGDAYSSLRGGLDGRLAEKGRNLSGGQRQRLALARVYATQAPILFLIEPTSALDAHTESLIARDMPAACAGRTAVIATHSPLILAQMDEVIVLDDNGQLAARGTYEELRHTSPELHRILGNSVQEETQ